MVIIQGPLTVSAELKNLPGGGLITTCRLDLMVPLRAGFGTLWSRLPGGHRARSLTPLFMFMQNEIFSSIRPVLAGMQNFPLLKEGYHTSLTDPVKLNRSNSGCSSIDAF